MIQAPPPDQRDPAMNPWDTFRAMYKRMDELEGVK